MPIKDISVKVADNIRILSASMVEKANSGHPGGPMGGADFMSVLFNEFLVFDPKNPTWHLRDRFFLDAGHLSAMLYSTLHLYGFYSMEDLKNFRQWGSPTPGHPEVDPQRGVENTSGPLGQGHTFGIGAAIAERFLVARFGEWMNHKTYIYITDGGIQEEIAQGAGRTAGFLGLSNVIMFYDANDIQLSTRVEEVTNEDVAKKYEAWGWKVITIQGNDVDELRLALKAANRETQKPTLIIGKTIMGKGAVTAEGKSFEHQVSTHGQPLSKAGASTSKTIENLGGDANNPFQLFPDVVQYIEKVKAEKAQLVAERVAKEKIWRGENPEKAKLYDFYLSGKAPAIDYKNIAQKGDQATRNASGNVLGHFAKIVGNMIVASADLCESDKTISFLKNSKAFAKGDFSGGFLQAGVSELTMAALAVGMSLHGGVIPVCATFFVFSDYMKPAIRLAALMQQPVKFVYTHDAFRVGEDGPTHQPIEQEAQIRLLEQLKNHHGKQSLLVLRPADVHETTVAWEMAMENTQSPSVLILSRQNIKDIPAKNASRYEEAQDAKKGAYVVKEVSKADIVFVGNGSEVSTLYAGALLLEKETGLKVQVVSAISEGLFRQQPTDYQEKILPSHLPILGLTAGLPVTLQGLVGARGKVIGLTHFGYSAPAEVLDVKFGYTPENVAAQAKVFLEEKR
jgi:transketolase